MVVEQWMPLTPPQTTKMLRYAENITLTTTSGVVNTYVYAANDAYDPNITGTGHQPMGFDQMMQLYNHFHIVKARIKVTFRNTSFGTPSVAIRVDASPTPLTAIERILEVGGLVTSVLEAAAGFGSDKTLDMSVDVARLQGVSRRIMLADPALGGSATASPTELTYFHLVTWDAAAATANLQLCVILEQLVTFSEPRDNVQSISRAREEAFVRVERKTSV